MKTAQEVRRSQVEELVTARLGEGSVLFRPISIRCREDFEEKKTIVSHSYYYETSGTSMMYQIKEEPGFGLVDCVFQSILRQHSESYSSLKNIRLANFIVKPIFGNHTSFNRSDAAINVEVSVEVGKYGLYDFRAQSKSVIRAAYESVVNIFQFYINCEKTFKMLYNIRADASKRQRPDIVASCVYDMSILTEMNSYEIS